MTARKKDAPRMSDEDCRFIYGILKKSFAFDEDYPLANLGWCFVREGINKEDYGFLKLKPMLEEMVNFVSTSTKEIGGVSQSMFALHEFAPFEDEDADSDVEDDEDASLSRAADEDAVDASDSAADASAVSDASDLEKDRKESSNQKDSKSKKSSKAQKDTNEGHDEDARGSSEGASHDGDADVASRAAKGDSSADAPNDEGDSKDEESSAGASSRKKGRAGKPQTSQAALPSSDAEVPPSRRLESAKEASGQRASGADSLEKPQADKGGAGKDDRAVVAKESAVKESSARQRQKSAEKPIEKRVDSGKRQTGNRPALSRMESQPRRRVIPGKALERFGYLGTWQEFLSTLADLALDEPWDFCDEGFCTATRRFDILHNYIRYTFYRLTLEDKIGFSSDEDFAAFNTGLVDRHYEDIYACFEPTNPEKQPEAARYKWTFAGFCTAGTGHWGKRLVREFNPLPQPASYLERKEDLLFDLDREVVCDVHHIVVDNVHRLPVNFLRDELASSQKCLGILAGIEELSEASRTERFDRLRDVIEHDTRLFNRISTSINAAIDVAKRQVRWNYKTAVPAYYPRTNSMNLLLPLILTDSPTPDVALVVELQKSGNYQGQTVVTMAQAYRDARLLCRPYIDWLSPASIIDAAEEEDEEE